MTTAIHQPNRLHSLIEGYVDREDGTILDIKNNLIWQKAGPRKKYTWREVKQYCLSLPLGGYTDWRLPTKEELRSLVNERYCPTIFTAFQSYKDWYWTSTPCNDNGIYPVWIFGFTTGTISMSIGNISGSSRYCVRAVRENK